MGTVTLPTLADQIHELRNRVDQCEDSAVSLAHTAGAGPQIAIVFAVLALRAEMRAEQLERIAWSG